MGSHSPKDYAILFDMDGVLVDVKNSYRKAILETVQFFSGEKPLPREIQQLKEKGGYNNDWDLTQALLIFRNKSVPKTEIIKKFQEFYLGTRDKKGFIENERWLLPKRKLYKLHKKYALGIVTGRPKEETLYVVRKFDTEKLFDVIVAMDDYPPEKSKPSPYPIKLALEKLGRQEAVYIGDGIDDIDAAKHAGILAIGCIPPGVSATRMRNLFMKQGAEIVLDRISDIDEALNLI
jgi:HAD superfamily hydrolase (TIGR01548 family)